MLADLEKQMSDCQQCDLCRHRTQIVFGEGNADKPLVMIIGEAPGEEEDREGRPFIGKCGKVVDNMLKYADLERSEVYITNSVICRPPNNRNPLTKEIEACRDRLLQHIKLVQPAILVLMGKIATQALVGEPIKGALSKFFEKRFRDMTLDGKDGKYVVTYHPSYLLRNRKNAYPILLKHWTDIKDEVARIKGSKQG